VPIIAGYVAAKVFISESFSCPLYALEDENPTPSSFFLQLLKIEPATVSTEKTVATTNTLFICLPPHR
jgi:hypothetical protein